MSEALPRLTSEHAQALLDEARVARTKAYVPYSRFQVGAALQTRDGTIYHGCNVENASFGLTNCAERTAFFRAIADGHRPGDFVALAVVGDTRGPIAPCGACRPVLNELDEKDLPEILGNLGRDVMATTAGELLPGAFDQQDLPRE